MHKRKTKCVIALTLLLTVAGVTSTATAQALNNNHAPDLPSPVCDNLQVPPGNKLVLQVHALGLQTYRWNGFNWVFVEPVATLFADSDYHEKIGIHYGGPTWESNSGSRVVAARLEGCSPDMAAIPWLLLQMVSTDGSDLFSRVTYIQRVNTTGGLAPTSPGYSIGAVANVPYTAEYYFYRGKN